MYKERKEITHGEIFENGNNIIYMYIYIYISKISTMLAITKWSQDQCTRDNVSEDRKSVV